MDLRFVSSLTADDEERLAPALLDLICAVLDQLSLTYTVEITTADGTKLQRSHTEPITQPTTRGGDSRS
jgi:hypothetical protein